MKSSKKKTKRSGAATRAGGGSKSGAGGKKSGGQSVVNRFGTPGGPSYTPQVWSPSNLRGSTTPNFDVGQNGQPAEAPVPISTISTNKAGGAGPIYNVYIQPANTPTTPSVTTGWSGVNRGGDVAITGQQCQSSNNKFRCCNNEGSGACAAAGFGDCCDSFRNMCVNTAGLDPTARSNLVCKP